MSATGRTTGGSRNPNGVNNVDTNDNSARTRSSTRLRGELPNNDLGDSNNNQESNTSSPTGEANYVNAQPAASRQHSVHRQHQEILAPNRQPQDARLALSQQEDEEPPILHQSETHQLSFDDHQAAVPRQYRDEYHHETIQQPSLQSQQESHIPAPSHRSQPHHYTTSAPVRHIENGHRDNFLYINQEVPNKPFLDLDDQGFIENTVFHEFISNWETFKRQGGRDSCIQLSSQRLQRTIFLTDSRVRGLSII